MALHDDCEILSHQGSHAVPSFAQLADPDGFGIDTEQQTGFFMILGRRIVARDGAVSFIFHQWSRFDILGAGIRNRRCRRCGRFKRVDQAERTGQQNTYPGRDLPATCAKVNSALRW